MRARVVAAFVVMAVALPAIALKPDRAISQYARRTWKLEDGLPNSVVRAVLSTDDGYIWIATYDGIARFNGDSFTVYDKRTLPELKRDTVLAFLKSRDGSLRIGTNGGGLARFRDGKLDEVVTLAQGLPSDVVTAICEARDGTVWVGTSGGVARVANGRATLAFDDRNGLGSRSVLSMVESPDGTLWIGTRGGGLHSVRGGHMQRYTTADGLASDFIYSLMPDRDGSLLIGTGAGLSRMVGTKITSEPKVPVDQVTHILRDSDGTLWIGTYANGLLRSANGHDFDRYSRKEGLVNNSVRGIYEDAEHNLWVGTNGGLERFSPGRFVTFGVPEGISDPYTRCVFEDRDGAIWIGTAEGLNRIAGGKVTVFTTKDGLSSDYILSVTQAPDGTMWIGTPTGLNHFAGGHFQSFTEKDGLTSRSTRALFFDREGTLWIGTDSGITRYADGKFTAVSPSPKWRTTFIQAFAQGPDGSVRIGSDGEGIAEYRNGVFTTIDETNGLPDVHVLCLLADADGTQWIGTDSAGLIRLRNGRATRYTVGSGLRGDKIVQILDDGKGRLWFGGGRGIWSIERKQLDDYADGKRKSVDSTVFGYGDGMRNLQCNGSVYPSGIRARDGRLWFPTVDGVATIDPRVLAVKNERQPPVKVESVLIDGRVITAPSTVTVPPGGKQIEIRYAALTYVSPQRVEFRYQLEGFDSDWIRAESRRVAYYTGVPPGRYHFRVIAANADGVWNRQGAALDVVLQPRFVQTVWFPIIVFLLLATSVWLFQQRRVYVMRRRENELVTLVDQRTRAIQEALVETEAANRAKSIFLANVSHELRTPLNAIIGFASVLEMTRDEKIEERHRRFFRNILVSGEHLLALINDILDLAKVEAGKMRLDLEPVSLSDIFDSVARVLKGLTLPRGIDLRIDVDPATGTFMADSMKIKQTIYNLVSNAVKFSPNGSTIRIEAKRIAAGESPLGVESIAMIVSDNGTGIPAHHLETIFEEFRQVHPGGLGAGLGLTLVRKFAELHHGTVAVTSAVGEGSRFTVLIPANLRAEDAA